MATGDPPASPYKHEIYLIRAIRPDGSRKLYIGQTQSHVMNHGKYRPFGARRRLAAHVSEALRKPSKECRKLNDAIRAHGSEAFSVWTLATVATAAEADTLEIRYIKAFGAVASGYNTCVGGRAPPLTQEQRRLVSASLTKHYSTTEARQAHSEAHVADHKKFVRFDTIDVERLRVLSLSPDSKTKRIVIGVTPRGGFEFKLSFGSQFQTFEEIRLRTDVFFAELNQRKTLPEFQIQEKFMKVLTGQTKQ